PPTYGLDLAISDRKMMRKPWIGDPFWKGGDGPPIHAVLIRAPLTFPPQRLQARILAGMGVWDARGTQGYYFYYYSTRPPLGADDPRGLVAHLSKENGVFKAKLLGPHVLGQAEQEEPFELTVGTGEATLRLQGKSYKLQPKRWSDWIRLEFSQGL